MGSQYFIGVDIGTAGTKVAIFDFQGNQLATAYEESRLYYPQLGWVEQEPEDFYLSTINIVKQVIKKSKANPKDIASIAFSGQMAGILAIDEDWNPVIRYDSWLDIRCKKYIDMLAEKHADSLISITGVPPTVDHLPKMLWWKNEKPEIFEKVCKFTVPAVYVAGKLAGLKGEEAFYDYTYTTFTGLFDIHRMEWSEELCQTFGIPINKLPRVVKPWDIVGELTAKEADRLGLMKGTPIVAGAGDGMACVFGAGANRPGICVSIAGTASAFYVSTERVVPDTKFRTLLNLKSVVPGLWSVGAYINGGGLCLRWFRDEMARDVKKEAENSGIDPYKLLDEAASKVPEGSEGLFFVPHMAGRAYPYNPKLKGLWIGFSWKHTLSHFFRSILEGIAYEHYHYLRILRNLLGEVQVREVREIGGGSKSKIWSQIKADILNMPYVLLNREEFAVLGLAVLGGYATGVFENYVKTIDEWVKPVERIEPRTEVHERYRKYAEFYWQLLERIDRVFEQHESLGKEEGLRK